MPNRNQERTFQTKKDLSSSNSCQESSLPNMMIKSPSLGRGNRVLAIQPKDGSQEAPTVQSKPSEQQDEADNLLFIKSQEGFEIRLPQLPSLDDTCAEKQTSNATDPESTVSVFLTCDPKIELFHSKTPSPINQFSDMPTKQEKTDGTFQKVPSFWRLVKLSLTEWLYAVLGGAGAAIFGAFNPLLAFIIALIATAYYRAEGHHLRYEVNKWCLIITCMGLVTLVANFLQNFYFGIMGEKMTERVRRMMFSGENFLPCAEHI